MSRHQAARYDQAVERTRDIVNRHDPIGLIALGAPADEYDHQIAKLTILVLGASTVDETVVDQIWIRSFGTEYSMSGHPTLTALAHDLDRARIELADSAD